MEVFVLLGNNGYDGEDVLGVYATVSDMADAARAYQGDFASEGFLFEMRVIGAAAAEGFMESYREELVL